MKGAIFLLQDGGLVEMNEQDYESEDLLQEFLAQYPALLAGDQIDTSFPRRWLLISRETPVPGEEGGGGRWSLDHLFLDQDAIPTLVEVKRSSDTRIRREVVGQMLDYAANAVLHWPVQQIQSAFTSRCEKRGLDADSELQKFLGAEGDPQMFWDRVKTNLKAEKVRLIFVADQIPPELQRVIEFLNGQMDPAEVLAVEIKQYAGQSLRTLVPRVIGRTAEAQAAKAASPRRQWDEPSFFDDLRSRVGAEDCAVARRIMDWAEAKSLSSAWGKGRTYGTYYPVLEHKEKSHRLFTVFSSGRIEIDFRDFPLEEEGKRSELMDRLNSIKGVSLPPEVLATWAGFPLSVLKTKPEFQTFVDTIDWAINKIRAL
jgi:hypothetical protein